MQAALTELEAVNDILLTTGYAPMNSFEEAAFDQTIARSELAKAVRDVCAHGFSFNTDEDYVLSPDANDGVILIPEGALSVDPSDRRQNLVQRKHPSRGFCLWDKANLTWIIAEPVKVNVTWSYSYDELPQIARNFAMQSAGNRFQTRMLGDATLNRFTSEDVQRAWTILLRDDARIADRNIFEHSPELAAKTNRRRRGWRAGM